jgi:hypothetical protein
MQFAMRAEVWNQERCPFVTGCPFFTGLHFTGINVQYINILQGGVGVLVQTWGTKKKRSVFCFHVNLAEDHVKTWNMDGKKQNQRQNVIITGKIRVRVGNSG